MKVSPIAQGTGVPAASDVGNQGRTVAPDRLARAKAIAAGTVAVSEPTPMVSEEPVAQSVIPTIKMKTQVSTNRDDGLAAEDPADPNGNVASATADTTEQVVATEETKPLNPQLAEIARARRALQVKEREILDRERALQSQAQTTDVKPDLVARLKSDPLGVLQEHGVTYDQLTQAILTNQQNNLPEIQALKTEIEALKKGLDTEFTKRDQLQEQQVLGQMKRDVEALTAQGDDYEAIRAAKAQSDVVDLIHRTYKKTGEILSDKEAADLVETQLIDEALPFAKIKKVQSRLTPTPEETSQQQQPPQRKGIKTLTNRDGTKAPISRRERAMRAFYGTK